MNCKQLLPHIVTATLLTICTLGFHSCFTGVEGTGKITISKKEAGILAPSAEDRLLSDIKPSLLKEWGPGRLLLVTDDKLRLITENTGMPVNQGDTVCFKEIMARHGADGLEKAVLVFNHDGGILTFPLDKNISEAKESVTASDLAMLIDLEAVEKVRERLKGKKVWTKTSLWYGDSLRHVKGRKFVPVTISDIEAGNSFFPVMVSFIDDEGARGRLLMSIGSAGNDSRSFGRLFSLKDPRDNYRQISDSNWAAIQNEQLIAGMTKEECRLSRGNPSDVNVGHDYTNTMEIWYYPNGSYLRFVDGLLVSFK